MAVKKEDRIDRIKRQATMVTIACILPITIIGVTLLIRFYVAAHGCSICFCNNTANIILLGILAGLIAGYMAIIATIALSIKQNRKEVKDNDKT